MCAALVNGAGHMATLAGVSPGRDQLSWSCRQVQVPLVLLVSGGVTLPSDLA
ncbi:hypothetical protein HFP71_38705 [Streptomyces sp. ARC32]